MVDMLVGNKDFFHIPPVVSCALPVIRKYIEDEIARYGQLSKEMEDDRQQEWEA